MNRLEFLKQTLPKNLEDNADYPDVEFVLLDYNSTDATESWVREKMIGHIESGRLVYYRENMATYFKPSHSRNVCMRLGTGDVLCNVDADNFTGEGFAEHLNIIFKGDYGRLRVFANHPNVYEFLGVSAHGRIALWRRDFMYLGGYAEKLVGWGEEDNDLNRRLMSKEDMFYRSMIDMKYLGAIEHDDFLRIQNIDFTGVKHQSGNPLKDRHISQIQNKNTIDQDLEKLIYVRNFGQNFGEAVVVKNFADSVVLENPWMRFV